MENIERNTRPTFQGVVVSDKMDKSLVVLVETYKKHSKYGKRVKYSKKFVAHDETNSAHVGDVVTIRGCRPLSKTKRFILVNIDKLAPTPIKKAVEDINEEISEKIDEATTKDLILIDDKDGGEVVVTKKAKTGEDIIITESNSGKEILISEEAPTKKPRAPRKPKAVVEEDK